MSMTDKVRSAMVAAMKASDKETKESLSLLLSALKNKAIDKRADLTFIFSTAFLVTLLTIPLLKKNSSNTSPANLPFTVS